MNPEVKLDQKTRQQLSNLNVLQSQQEGSSKLKFLTSPRIDF
jgi:hypothetical protein